MRSKYGVLLRPHWRDLTFRYAYWGDYGDGLSNYLKGIKHAFIFMDIGANQGLFSLLAAQNENCHRVFAFEPVLETFWQLNENITANKKLGLIVPVRAAVGDRSDTVPIQLKKGHSGAATLRQSNIDSHERSEKVRMISFKELEDLIEGIECPNIVFKIDVEGLEMEIIRCLIRSRIVRRVVGLCYEVDDRWTDMKSTESMLRACGFTNFQVFGEGGHFDVLALRSGDPYN